MVRFIARRVRPYSRNARRSEAVGRATVRAIVHDRAEIVVFNGPGRTLRAVMDRFPGMGPAVNRMTGAEQTMRTIAEFREREAQLTLEP